MTAQLYDAFPGQLQPFGMAEFVSALPALRRHLVGLWVAVDTESRITVAAPPDDSNTLVVSDDLFIPHPFCPGIFRAAMQHCCLMPHAELLWLKHDTRPWRPHTRPGLSELCDPPPAPDTSLPLDDVMQFLSLAAGVWHAEVHHKDLFGHKSTCIEVALGAGRRTWLHVYHGRVDIAEIHATP